MVSLSDLQVDSALSYAVALIFPALDAVVALVASETAVVGLGVTTAGSIDRILLLVLLAATGAFLGDNLCYGIGDVSDRGWTGSSSPARTGWPGRGGRRGHSRTSEPG